LRPELPGGGARRRGRCFARASAEAGASLVRRPPGAATRAPPSSSSNRTRRGVAETARGVAAGSRFADVDRFFGCFFGRFFATASVVRVGVAFLRGPRVAYPVHGWRTLNASGVPFSAWSRMARHRPHPPRE
jgi:hypothetical protein